MKSMDKTKAARAKNIILVCLLCAGLVFTCYFAVLYAMDLRERGDALDFYNSLPTPQTPVGSDQAPEAHEEKPAGEAQVPAWTPFVDFEALRVDFPDTVAWIRIEGADVDYPIMHGEDNEYYLSHLPNRQQNRLGSIFLDYRNAPEFTDTVSLIYGHNMRSGEMFGPLENYSEQGYYEKHLSAMLHTPKKDYEIHFFASYILDPAGEVPPMQFKDAAAFYEHIADIRNRSSFNSSVDVAYGDRLVCLCTCDYSLADGRQIVVGKLVEQ
jgi:sortase B